MQLRSAHGYYEAKLKSESLDGGNCSLWATLLHFIVEIPNLHGNCKTSYHIIVLVHIIMLPVIYNHLYATIYVLLTLSHWADHGCLHASPKDLHTERVMIHAHLLPFL